MPSGSSTSQSSRCGTQKLSCNDVVTLSNAMKLTRISRDRFVGSAAECIPSTPATPRQVRLIANFRRCVVIGLRSRRFQEAVVSILDTVGAHLMNAECRGVGKKTDSPGTDAVPALLCDGRATYSLSFRASSIKHRMSP